MTKCPLTFLSIMHFSFFFLSVQNDFLTFVFLPESREYRCTSFSRTLFGLPKIICALKLLFCYCNGSSLFSYLPHSSAPFRHQLDWITHSLPACWLLEPRCACFCLSVLAQYQLNYAFWVCGKSFKGGGGFAHLIWGTLSDIGNVQKMIPVAVFILPLPVVWASASSSDIKL